MPSFSGVKIKPLGALAAGIAQLQQSLYQPPDDSIRSIKPQDWPSPLQPVKPLMPQGAEPLGWQFNFGQNLNFTPRPDSEYSFEKLREISQYDLVRVIIENVKDVITRTPWEIQALPNPGEDTPKAALERKRKAASDDNVLRLTDLWSYPDGENDWGTWTRNLLEDMLVIDAPSTLIRKTHGGEVAEMRVIDGATIVRYIDSEGYTPKPPDPAYAQLWEGIPRVNLTTDQLIYRPRNIVRRNTTSSHLYGMSPVEQAATWIATGMARLQFQQAYYTAGSIPDVVQVVPPGTPPSKITEAMNWMNSELAGELNKRRQWRMVQGFETGTRADQILFTKEKLLSDPFDDLVIRLLCFAFGTSPQRLMQMMNRATAEANQEAAEMEGYLPFLFWLRNYINFIIQRKMGMRYQIVFDPQSESDPQKQAEAEKTLVAGAIKTINESREDIGLEPRPEPEADELGIITANGFTPVGQAKQEFALNQKRADESHALSQEQGKFQMESAKKENENGTNVRGGSGAGSAAAGGAASGGSGKGGSSATGGDGEERSGGSAEKGVGCGDHDSPNVGCPDCIVNAVLKATGVQTDARGKATSGSSAKSASAQAVGFLRAEQHSQASVLAGRYKAMDSTHDRPAGGAANKLPWSCAVHPRADLDCQDCLDVRAAHVKIRGEQLKLRKYWFSAGALNGEAATAKANMEAVLAHFFQTLRNKAAELIIKHNKSIQKASSDVEENVDLIMDSLQDEFYKLPSKLRSEYMRAVRAGIERGLGQLQYGTPYEDQALLGANRLATEWADNAAAELVGKKLVNGKLVDNPDAKYRITDKVRSDIQDIISQSISDGDWTQADVADAIQEAGGFSDSRAEMIARTESSKAEVMGNLAAWKETGVVDKIEWFTAGDTTVCDICEANDGEVRKIGRLFPSGDSEPPVHPNCRCQLAAAEQEQVA